MEIFDGTPVPKSVRWSEAYVAWLLWRQLNARSHELGLMSGSGDLNLIPRGDVYVPTLALVPNELAKVQDGLTVEDTLLVIEVTSTVNGLGVKTERYGMQGCPLLLWVDRHAQECTLYANPGESGFRRQYGPWPFGETLRLPAPFNLTVDTDNF